MGILTVIGIVSTFLFAALALWFLIRLAMVRFNKTPSTLSISGELASYWGEDRYRTLHSSRIAAFYNRYRRLYDQVPIPRDADTIIKCSCVFSLEHVPIEHYAWTAGGAVYYFPKWRSIAAYLHDPEYLRPHRSGDENNLYGWKIPINNILHYRIDEENGITTVEYSPRTGKRFRTVFLDGGAQFFRLHLPTMDIKFRKRMEYLGSYKSIKDMEKYMQELKGQREAGSISEEEYQSERSRIMSLF